MQQPRWILASDIDHTLTGDPETLKKLAAKIDTICAKYRSRQQNGSLSRSLLADLD
jgi:hypothetical protein